MKPAPTPVSSAAELDELDKDEVAGTDGFVADTDAVADAVDDEAAVCVSYAATPRSTNTGGAIAATSADLPRFAAVCAAVGCAAW